MVSSEKTKTMTPETVYFSGTWNIIRCQYPCLRQ